MLMRLVTAFTLFASCQATAEPQVDVSKAMIIDQVIQNSTIGPLTNSLYKKLVTDTLPDEIHLVINSPGGEVTSGFRFVTVMHAAQAKGTKFICFVPSLAASMAFHIYTQCDKRYALSGAALLWHRARVMIGGLFGQPLTGPMAAMLGKQLMSLDAIIWDAVNSSVTGMSEEEKKEHFEAETLHMAAALAASTKGFLSTKNYIPGLLEVLSNPDVPRTASGGMDGIRKRDLIYIDPRITTN